MSVYLDVVFILNFLVDFILLVSVDYILRRNVKWWRLFLGALFGNITILFLFSPMNNILLLFFKVIISVVLNIIVFGYKDLKYTLKNILYFYLVSMLLGGAVEFLRNQFRFRNNGVVFIDNGLGLSYIIIFVLGLYVFFNYIKCFKDLKNNYSNYYKCIIYYEDSSIVVNAFLDTGNKLKDPYSNKSIVLIDKEKICDLNVRSPVYVPYNSLNNHGLLTCYNGFKLEIDGLFFDKFLIGVSDEKFYMDGIDCILNNSVLEGLK